MSTRRILPRIATATALAGACLAGGALAAAPAGAAAATTAVYPPVPVAGDTAVTGSANLVGNCSGTVGCSNTISIDRDAGAGWQSLTAGPAPYAGMNTLTTATPLGCAYYRTTVQNDNDIPGYAYTGGVNVGLVGYTGNGVPVYRYRSVWSSPATTICR